MEGGPPRSSSQRADPAPARSVSLPPALSSRQPSEQLQLQVQLQPRPQSAHSLSETCWQMPLREAVDLNLIPAPALMHWDDWQRWRKGEGSAPKGISREEYFQHASREGQLYKDTMAYYHGPAWKERLENEQGIRHKEQPYRGFRVRRSSPPTGMDAGSAEAAALGERHARQVPLSEAQQQRLMLAESVPVPSFREALTPRSGPLPVELPPTVPGELSSGAQADRGPPPAQGPESNSSGQSPIPREEDRGGTTEGESFREEERVSEPLGQSIVDWTRSFDVSEGCASR